MENERKRRPWISKYGNALKTLIPIRRRPKTKEIENVGDSAGCLSYLSISWMSRIMYKAYKTNEISESQVGKLSHDDLASPNQERLQFFWRKEVAEKGEENASFVSAIIRFNRTRVLVATTLIVLCIAAQFVGSAWVLSEILDFIQTTEGELWTGLIWVAVFSITQLIRNATYNAAWVTGVSAGLRTKGALQMMIFEKVLRVHTGGENLIGEVVSYCMADAERIHNAVMWTMLVFVTPVMLFFCIGYTVQMFGVWALIGNFVVLLFYPFMAWVARITSKLRVKSSKITDARIGAVNQMFSNIKILKMYGWEEPFTQKVTDLRKKEENVLQKAAFLQSIGWTATPIVSVVGPMVIFIAYVLAGNNLTVSQAFTVIPAFASLHFSLNTLPIAIKNISEGIVSCKRIQKFLAKKDSVSPNCHSKMGPKDAVVFAGATLSWEDPIDGASGDLDESEKSKLKKEKRRRRMKRKLAASRSNSYRNSPFSVTNSDGSAINGAFVSDGSDQEENPEVQGLDLVIEKGTLVGICGSVGSGKSTLLNAIIGNVKLLKGHVGVGGTVAFVPQQAWIFNATVRDNILFGLPYDKSRYETVVEACGLLQDFKLMSNGDETEICERGGNLSGGQKQRVSIARAMYSDQDIYLLDDPLSAVDSRVSRHIFQRCIKEELQGKTVLLVTHAINLLEQCDQVVYLKDGKVLEKGTHRNLVNAEGEYAKRVLMEKNQKEENSDGLKGEDRDEMRSDDASADEKCEEEAESKSDGRLVSEEVDGSRSMDWSTFVTYMNACGGPCALFFAILLLLVFNGVLLFSNIWLQQWLDYEKSLFATDDNITRNNGTIQKSNQTIETMESENYYNSTATNRTFNVEAYHERKTQFYMLVYGMTGVAVIILGVIKGFVIGKIMLLGASRLHNTMLRKVARSPTNFFDCTPIGRILNRFSRDMDELDANIPFCSEFVVQTLLLILMLLILTGVLFPWYFIPLTIIIAIVIYMDRVMNVGVKETKRLENLSVSPVLVNLSTAIEGIPTIRTFNQQKLFVSCFEKSVDGHLSKFMLSQLSSKWFSFRMDILAWIVVTAIALLVVCFRDSISAASAGLAISSMFQVFSIVAVGLRWKAELQARLISVQRVADYCRNLIEEAPPQVECDDSLCADWPNAGNIAFNNVELRYRDDLPLVLQGLNVVIKGGEKIGIVGRTGAGKSSIMVALLRLVETSSGNIVIDNVDVSGIGLTRLRSSVAVIPQDPALFDGTIRYNLDPTGTHSDVEIWEALEKSHLKKKIEREQKQLEATVGADGGGFSVGERQLLCLARALLRKNKILLLDEATASVDLETDNLIQCTIRQAFKDCTVLTVAHRLFTVIDSDKILVMEAGKVKEFDNPQTLMNKEHSVFRSMMLAASTNPTSQ